MDKPRHDSGAASALELVAALEQALLAERDALRRHEPEVLDRAVRAKTAALSELNREPVRSGLEAILRGAPDAASDRGATRDALVDRLSRCRELNETAGGVIAALRKDTQTALGTLGIATEPDGYERSGRSPGSSPRRALAVG